ncbi:hydrogenase maturation nickel metallochaperone HypA [Arhodomonas sp. AD133]|uniref:hydrogenase maturation nickel metallochaperone HypA/HybF n=1 Tax=Arhodomonas sp. AD133 TaxID=3415009 RepID=UPI003EC11E5B
MTGKLAVHELALTESIIAACRERADGAPVLRVTVEVGRLTCVMPEALRLCFEACSAGTELEAATLEIVATPGRARCRDCGRDVMLDHVLAACACGSVNLTVPQGGDRLCVRSMELGESLMEE